jgi:DNA-binding response OmpR family regulator
MGSAKILIVDDEAYLTSIVTMKLNAAGYCTVCAADGEEGFKLAVAEKPDLIITDYQMPILSGLEMSIQLRHHPGTATIPVLLLTARGHRIDETQLAQTSVRHIVNKPFSSRDLLDKVRETLAPQAKASAA